MYVCCIIKPVSRKHDAQVLARLRAVGVDIVQKKEILYTCSIVNVLYDHMTIEARNFIYKRYEGREGLALLLSFGDLDSCMNMVGRESDPGACEAHTIRALFGEQSEPECIGSWLWWENAIHRPVDERERKRDLSLIFPEYTD